MIPRLLLCVWAIAEAVPLRIASDGVDSVVVSPAGSKETLVIDTASNFHVERLDAPIERIEIRLIDENSTTPLVIDIQKMDAVTEAPKENESGNERVSDNTRHVEIRIETQAETPPPSEGQAESPDTLVDDLPPLNETEETDEVIDEGPVVEECLLNKDQLSDEVVERLQRQKRRLSQLIRQVNRQQAQFCRPDVHAEQIEYSKCPMWREEKMVHYYKFMRLTYCSDYTRWPNAPKLKRSYAAYLPLFEKLYAFMQKQ